MKPIRMCVACKERFEKEQLIRFVKQDDNIVVDKTKNIFTRGCYLCSKQSCKEKLIKQKILNKVFKTNFSSDYFKNLLERV